MNNTGITVSEGNPEQKHHAGGGVGVGGGGGFHPDMSCMVGIFGALLKTFLEQKLHFNEGK